MYVFIDTCVYIYTHIPIYIYIYINSKQALKKTNSKMLFNTGWCR